MHVTPTISADKGKRHGDAWANLPRILAWLRVRPCSVRRQYEAGSVRIREGAGLDMDGRGRLALPVLHDMRLRKAIGKPTGARSASPASFLAITLTLLLI